MFVFFTFFSCFLACEGDSGGPLTTKLGNGKLLLIGVISFGYECEPGCPMVSTFIPAIRDWIKSITGLWTIFFEEKLAFYRTP